MKNWRCSAAACTTARAPAPCGVPARGAPRSRSPAERPRRRICSTASTRRGTACPAAARSRRFSTRRFAITSRRIPERVIPALVKARPLIAAIADPLAKIKLAELDETIALCAGLFVEAQARQSEVAPGATLNITTTVLNRSSAKVGLEGARVEGIWNQDAAGQARHARLQPERGGGFQSGCAGESGLHAAVLAGEAGHGRCLPGGRPDADRAARYAGRGAMCACGLRWMVRRSNWCGRCNIVTPIAPVASGCVPLVVVPAVAVNLPEPVALFPDTAARQVQVSVQANVANAQGELRLEVPAGWKAEPASQNFEIAVSGEQRVMTFQVTPPAGETTASLRAVAKVKGRDIASGIQVIAYPHIPPQTLFPPSDIKLVRANIKVTAKKVGLHHGRGRRDAGCAAATRTRCHAARPERSGAGRPEPLRCDRGRRSGVQCARRYSRQSAAPARLREEWRHVRGAIPDGRQPRPHRAARPAAAAESVQSAAERARHDESGAVPVRRAGRK